MYQPHIKAELSWKNPQDAETKPHISSRPCVRLSLTIEKCIPLCVMWCLLIPSYSAFKFLFWIFEMVHTVAGYLNMWAAKYFKSIYQYGNNQSLYIHIKCLLLIIVPILFCIWAYTQLWGIHRYNGFAGISFVQRVDCNTCVYRTLFGLHYFWAGTGPN